MLDEMKVSCESEDLFNLSMKYKKDGDYENSIKYCIQAAELSNPKAEFMLAMYYSEGIYLQSDRENIFLLYKKAADRGLAEAQKFTADHYFFGDGVEKDRQVAVEYYQKAAENGEVSSMEKLADLYFKGEIVKKDENLAVQYLEMADEKNYPIAQLKLGDYYLKKHEDEKAFYYYKKASQKDLAKAHIRLGDCYLEAVGTKRDDEKAFNYYRLAQLTEFNRIELGLYSVVSFYKAEYLKTRLGQCYYEGLGVEANPYIAYEYFEEAAGLGYEKAEEYLKKIDISNIRQKDLNEAKNLFEDYENYIQQGEEELAIDSLKNSAKEGYCKALNMLGGFCLSGYIMQKDEDEAILYYKKSADNMDEIAQFILANHYKDLDAEKSMQYFKLCASSNSNSIANYNVGIMYFEGRAVELDYDMAFKYFNLAAKQDLAEAVCALGNCYFNGFGVQKDSNKAVSLWEKAENMGYEGAKIHLANYYESLKTKEGDEKALFYHKILADSGVVSSKYYLACHYEKEKNYEKAFELFRQTADEGFSFSQDRLSNFYLNGIYTDRDVEKGIYYLELAAKQNHAIASLKLGDIYYNGDYNVKVDYQKAFEYFSAAENLEKTVFVDGVNMFGHVHGTAEARFKTAMCYYNGFGVQKDYEQAAERFVDSANQGYEYAQNMAGLCYLNGLGVLKDAKKAVEYFTLAEEKGLEDAEKNLGICYIKGEGVNRDIKKAIKYFSSAAEKGNTYCQNILASMYFRGKLVERDYSKVAYYYGKIAEKNNPEAIYILGLLYESGKGVEKDMEVAKKYYQKAAGLGMQKAKDKVNSMD